MLGVPTRLRILMCFTGIYKICLPSILADSKQYTRRARTT